MIWLPHATTVVLLSRAALSEIKQAHDGDDGTEA